MAHDRHPPGPALTGEQLVDEFVTALGLPADTNLIQIRIAHGEVVEVVCRYYPDATARADLLTLWRRYQVVPVKDVGAAPTPEATSRLSVDRMRER